MASGNGRIGELNRGLEPGCGALLACPTVDE